MGPKSGRTNDLSRKTTSGALILLLMLLVPVLCQRNWDIGPEMLESVTTAITALAKREADANLQIKHKEITIYSLVII